MCSKHLSLLLCLEFRKGLAGMTKSHGLEESFAQGMPKLSLEDRDHGRKSRERIPFYSTVSPPFRDLGFKVPRDGAAVSPLDEVCSLNFPETVSAPPSFFQVYLETHSCTTTGRKRWDTGIDWHLASERNGPTCSGERCMLGTVAVCARRVWGDREMTVRRS